MEVESKAFEKHEKIQELLKYQIEFLRGIRENLGAYSNPDLAEDLSQVISALEKVKKLEMDMCWNFIRNE